MQDQTKVTETKDTTTTTTDPSAPPNNNLNKVLNLIQKDHSLAKTVLAKLSGTEAEQPVSLPSEFDFLDNLNKPTWIDNVKKVQKNIMTPEVKKKEIIEKPKPVKTINEELQAEKEKEEEYKQYPFFTIVRKIMYANGDMKGVRDDSVVAMHIFLNKVIEAVFDKHTLAKYFEPDKKHEKQHNEKSFRHKSSLLKKLLSKLCPQEYFKFFQFNKIAKNVERLDYDLEKTTEAVDESKLFNYESDNDSEDGLSFKLINCNIRDEEKANFNHQRMEKLNEEGYLDFVSCRSTNFLSDGRDKFLSFIDFESKDLGFLAKNKTMVEFIAYILCRVVGNAIENIVRNEHHGNLKPLSEPIPPSKIEAEADKHLNHLKFQAKKAIRDSLSIEEIAFRLYLKECRDQSHHDTAFHNDPEPTKHRKTSVAKEEPERIFLEDDNSTPIHHVKKSAVKTDWKKLPATTKKQWIDRVMAEKQFKGLLEKPEGEEEFKWEDIDPVNSYAEYLINSLKGYKDKNQITDQVYHELFKSYQNNEAPHPHIELQKQPEDKINENINQSNQSSVAKGELISGKESVPKAVTGKKRRLESIFE